MFQDFFVTQDIYEEGRGFLNSFAIYSIGIIASIIGMLYFRKQNQFKYSEESSYLRNFSRLRRVGVLTVLLSFVLIIPCSFGVFVNTFPDLIAIYDPFKGKLGLHNIDYRIAFLIFALSFVMILTLIINSLWYTGPRSSASASVQEFSKISFSLNLLRSDFYSSFAMSIPIIVFFAIIMAAYEYGNAFGTSLVCLGTVAFYQLIHFFQNFQNLHFYSEGILSAGKQCQDEDESYTEKIFRDIIQSFKLYSKFSIGCSLFIHLIMCFTLLTDSFNMHLVDQITVFDPYSIIGIMVGVFGIQILISLELHCLTKFTMYLMHRINIFFLPNIDTENYVPDLKDIGVELIYLTFFNQTIFFFIPVIYLFIIVDCGICHFFVLAIWR